MEKEKIVIFGAGGLGVELTTWIRDINAKKDRFDLLGFVDDTPELQGKTVAGFSVLGDSSWLLNYDGEIGVVIAVGLSQGRKKVFERLSQNPNISFPNIHVDEDKFYHPEVLGNVKGCVIGYHNLISRFATFGDFVFIDGLSCVGHGAKIGSFVSLFIGSHIPGDVIIGECAQINSGARIMPGKSVGENATVGMGSIVVKNVAPNTTVFGNPARVIS